MASHVRLNGAWVWEGQSTDWTLKWTFARVCPHVRAKICRLTEQPITDTALVWLRPIVYGTTVLLQATLKLELSRAVRTQIGVVVAVHLTNVASQHRWQFELFSTLGACVRPVIRVFEDNVPPKKPRPLETDSTLAADVWSEIEVNFLMRVPRTRLSKSFTTVTTRIRPLSRMTPHVLIQGCSKRTATSTDAANKRLILATVVLAHVFIEKFHFPILFIAFGARVPLRSVRRVVVVL